MMKKIIFVIAAALALAACCKKEQLSITVSNPLDMERTLETVEIPWDAVKTALFADGLTPFAVFDGEGNELPSQVLYKGDPMPQSLIFQATVAPSSASEYFVRRVAEQPEYPTQAFGRYVPERLDDYAWENNMVAFRVYGPALADPKTPGVDVWNKRPDAGLVIDEWYKIGDYHHDIGKGMDAYKVANTLGGGASAPFADGKLFLGGNYVTQENLDNGPIRTSARFTFDTIDVNGQQVLWSRVISLDANSRFNKMVARYASAQTRRLPVAAGIVVHDNARLADGEGYIALTEPCSDSQTPVEDGDISLAVIMPGVSTATQADGHWLLVADALLGEPFVFYTGSGWSKNGVENDAAWIRIVQDQLAKINTPFEISYK